MHCRFDGDNRMKIQPFYYLSSSLSFLLEISSVFCFTICKPNGSTHLFKERFPWNELIPDALGLIFSKLNGQEVLGAIPLVCKPWCKVVEGPYWLQRIDTRHFLHETSENETEIVKVKRVLRSLVPRSSGYLRDLYVSFTDDYILSFIAKHAGSLESLDIGIGRLNDSKFKQFATKLGTLTTLVVRSAMSQRALEAIVKNCKRLMSLSWDRSRVGVSALDCGDWPLEEDDCFALPNLKHLSLCHANLIGQSCIFRLLSGSPQLEWVEIGGLKLDPTVVKEKYPNIVTLNISNVPVFPGGFNDIWEYLSHVANQES